MDEPESVKKRRMGPVGFHGEAKVTSIGGAPASNKGGMGEASGPFLETPHGAKELKVAGPVVSRSRGASIGMALHFQLLLVGRDNAHFQKLYICWSAFG